MAGKQEKSEEMVSKIRQVEVLQEQGVTQQSRLTRLRELEQENQRLRRAVSDLTLDTLILTEAAKGNFRALHVVGNALSMCGRSFAYPSAASAAFLVHTGPSSARFRKSVPMKNV